MKTMINCLKYEYKQYLLSARFIVPAVLYSCLMGFMFSILPIDIVSIFALMSLFLFALMAWVGASCRELEPEVSEQILILRIQSARKYYYTRIIFGLGISGLVALVSLIYAILSHYLHNQKLFSRGMVPLDPVGSFLLMFLCGFLGYVVGQFFTPCIFPSANVRTTLTLLVVMLSVVREGIVDQWPLTRFFLWLIPPVSDVVAWFTREEFYRPERLIPACLILLAYGIIIAILWVELSVRRKY